MAVLLKFEDAVWPDVFPGALAGVSQSLVIGTLFAGVRRRCAFAQGGGRMVL